MKKILFLAIIFGATLFLAQKTNAQTATCPGTCRINSCPSGEVDAGQQYNSTCPNMDYVCCKSTSSTPSDTVSSCVGQADGTLCEGNGVSGVCQNYLCSASSAGVPLSGSGNQTTSAPTPQTGASGGGTLPISGAGAPGGGTGVQPSGTGIVIPEGTGLPAPQGGIAQIIRNLLTWLLGIVGVIAIIGFVISGIQYLTSTGDEDRMQSAKRNMLYAIIGVVVVLSSFVVIQAIQYALEARSMF